MPVLSVSKQFYDAAEVVILARELGLEHVTARTVEKAAYYGDKPLKRTKIGGRVYYALADIENWISGGRMSGQ